eukprot:11354539-Alexandrium_andersonii.AAC.1
MGAAVLLPRGLPASHAAGHLSAARGALSHAPRLQCGVRVAHSEKTRGVSGSPPLLARVVVFE